MAKENLSRNLENYYIHLFSLSSNEYSNLIASALVVMTILCAGLIAYGLLRLVITGFIRSRLRNSNFVFLNLLGQSPFLSRLVVFVLVFVVANNSMRWLDEGILLDAILFLCRLFLVIFFSLLIFSFLDILQKYLLQTKNSQAVPWKGITQTLKIINTIATVILLISLLIGQSPLILLSGLGAMTAVLMLIFKDPILGLVAGVQLSANQMLRVGDWLEMPKYNADGEVTDISLTTVKVNNWDKTMTTIPTYALISDSFKNWRTMSESGGRRIKRHFFIDASSVHFLSASEFEQLKKSNYLSDYLVNKDEEINQYNKNVMQESALHLDGRQLTNLGTFRAYLIEYLSKHPMIHNDMTQLVRQLQPDEKGIPIEIYAFTNTVAWAEYERIQSDIFDHIYAVVGLFNLRVYQSPSGYDFQAGLLASQTKIDSHQ